MNFIFEFENLNDLKDWIKAMQEIENDFPYSENDRFIMRFNSEKGRIETSLFNSINEYESN